MMVVVITVALVRVGADADFIKDMNWIRSIAARVVRPVVLLAGRRLDIVVTVPCLAILVDLDGIVGIVLGTQGEVMSQ